MELSSSRSAPPSASTADRVTRITEPVSFAGDRGEARWQGPPTSTGSRRVDQAAHRRRMARRAPRHDRPFPDRFHSGRPAKRPGTGPAAALRRVRRRRRQMTRSSAPRKPRMSRYFVEWAVAGSNRGPPAVRRAGSEASRGPDAALRRGLGPLTSAAGSIQSGVNQPRCAPIWAPGRGSVPVRRMSA
jgi:hypothetical protein